MSKSSANILVFGWALILLACTGYALIFGMNTKILPSSELFISGDCPFKKSFYQKIDLSNSEKQQFSNNAVALEAIGESGANYRIIMDYSYISDLRDKLKVKILVRSAEGGQIDSITASPLLNGLESQESNTKDSSGKTPWFTTVDLNLSTKQNSLGILVSKQNSCEVRVNDLLSFDQTGGVNKSSSFSGSDSTIKALFDDELALDSGVNYFGCADWANFDKITRAGFTVSYFDPKQKKWVKEKSFGQPGKTYIINNPSPDKLKINAPDIYRVPDDINSPQLSQGWNLLYLDGSKTIDQMRVFFNSNNKEFSTQESYSISHLVDNGFASSSAFTIKDGKLIKIDLKDTSSIDQGPFWFFISKEPSPALKQINLSLSIDGGGDSYQKQQFIPFKVTLTNNDSTSHYLIPSGIVDPCQLKVTITDAKAKTVFDSSSDQVCPFWPKLEELSPGAKKEYNYTWRVPSNLTGELTMRAYFDYSRLDAEKLIGEAKVSVK